MCFELEIENMDLEFGATLEAYFIIYWNQYSLFQFVAKCQNIGFDSINMSANIQYTLPSNTVRAGFSIYEPAQHWNDNSIFVSFGLLTGVSMIRRITSKISLFFIRILSFLSFRHEKPRVQYWIQIKSQWFVRTNVPMNIKSLWFISTFVMLESDSFLYKHAFVRNIRINNFYLKFISVFKNIAKQKYSVPRNYESTKFHSHQVSDSGRCVFQLEQVSNFIPDLKPIEKSVCVTTYIESTGYNVCTGSWKPLIFMLLHKKQWTQKMSEDK